MGTMLRMVLVSAFALLFFASSLSCVVVPNRSTRSRTRYVKVKKSKRVRCKRNEFYDGRRCQKHRKHKKYKKHKKHKKHRKHKRRY